MTRLAAELIAAKRDGRALEPTEIEALVAGIGDGGLGDAQVAAFAMAVFFQGLNPAERIALTRAMAASGTVLDWRPFDLPGPVVDKHSTGGVGDKVSLILAPLVAAAGAFVPMISGAGLGHTGGTLDKLAAIPGYDTAPDLDRFQRVVRQTGCAIIGQTDDLAPADRRLYGIRDVTATVAEAGLITASILSKKLAAGLGALVMDVKTGSGAFLAGLDAARDLADGILQVARGAGLACTAWLTDMNQVLGTTAGNALEVAEATRFLTGRARDPRLDAVVETLGAEMLVLSGLYDAVTAPHAVQGALNSGTAAERFAAMVAALGGPRDLLEKPEKHLARAPVTRPVIAPRRATVTAIDVRRLGLAVVRLGGGRARAGDAIDPAVGLSGVQGPGFRTGPNRPLALVHARTEDQAEAAVAEILAAFRFGETAPDPAPVVIEKRA